MQRTAIIVSAVAGLAATAAVAAAAYQGVVRIGKVRAENAVYHDQAAKAFEMASDLKDIHVAQEIRAEEREKRRVEREERQKTSCKMGLRPRYLCADDGYEWHPPEEDPDAP